MEDQPMTTILRKFFDDESGATAIEYGLIAALIAVFLIASLNALGDALGGIFNNITTELGNAAPG